MKKTLAAIIFTITSLTAFSQQKDDFWELLNTPEGAEDLCDIAQIIGDTLLLSTWDSGLYISYNNGVNWQKNSSFTKTENIYVTKDKKVFIGQHRSYIYYSLDTCKTWQSTSYLGAASFFEISIYVDSNDYIYAGSDGSIIRSTDMGLTWECVCQIGWGSYTGVTLCKHPFTNDLFAGVISYEEPKAGVLRSSTGDSGTWGVFKSDPDFVSAMAFDSSGNMYLGTSGHYYNWSSLLYKSENFGNTWDILDNGYSVSSIVCLTNNDVYYGSNYTGSDGGVFFKSDTDSIFHEVPSNFSLFDVERLRMINDYLYAIDGFELALFRSVNPILYTGFNILNNEEKNGEICIFPNPLQCQNNWLEIKSSFEEKWELDIFGLNGEIFYSNNLIGSNKIRIWLNDLSKGIYIIRAKKGGEFYLKKLVVL